MRNATIAQASILIILIIITLIIIISVIVDAISRRRRFAINPIPLPIPPLIPVPPLVPSPFLPPPIPTPVPIPTPSPVPVPTPVPVPVPVPVPTPSNPTQTINVFSIRDTIRPPTSDNLIYNVNFPAVIPLLRSPVLGIPRRITIVNNSGRQIGVSIPDDVTVIGNAPILNRQTAIFESRGTVQTATGPRETFTRIQ